MKKALFGVIVSFGASIVSCDLLDGLDNEALRLGKEYYEKRLFLKCGDSWFGRIVVDILPARHGFLQVKNLEYVLRKDPLSEADKANGIEWNGRLSITGKMFRIYNPGGWSEWRDWAQNWAFNPAGFMLPPVSIHRINGQWQVGNAPLPNKIDFSCSQIPG